MCPGGICHAGECCKTCWDGTTCQLGTSPGACGKAGAACASCNDGKECTDDVCSSGVCQNPTRTGSCNSGGGVCVAGSCQCGGDGQPCCTNSLCSATFVCDTMKCRKCKHTDCTNRCGTLPDECSGTIQCGGCPDGGVCGAGGPSICG
jgi:hypothetical protein